MKPHCLAKSWNFFDVHCGPSSDQNMLGTPVQQNDCLTTLMNWGTPEQRKSKSRQLLPGLVDFASIYIIGSLLLDER